jgi:CRISPR/Cas system CSM-associated protein Csm2 small subunit
MLPDNFILILASSIPLYLVFIIYRYHRKSRQDEEKLESVLKDAIRQLEDRG